MQRSNFEFKFERGAVVGKLVGVGVEPDPVREKAWARSVESGPMKPTEFTWPNRYDILRPIELLHPCKTDAERPIKGDNGHGIIYSGPQKSDDSGLVKSTESNRGSAKGSRVFTATTSRRVDLRLELP